MNLELLLKAKEAPLSAEELATVNSQLSPFEKYIGLEFTHLAGDYVEAKVEAHPGIHQFTGVVNGGAFATIGEIVGSVAGVINAQAPVFGVNNSSDFLRSVSEGTIVAKCSPIYIGRRTQLWKIEMECGGKLAATCQLRTMVANS